MLGNGFVDKNGNKLDIKKLYPLVFDGDNIRFLLKVIEKADSYIKFNVYKISAWERHQETTEHVEYSVPIEVKLYLSASIKWDGCSHFLFGEKENGQYSGYLYLCGKYYFDLHTQLMQELFEFASTNIKRFDKEIAW